jgi:hypothetical protein
MKKKTHGNGSEREGGPEAGSARKTTNIISRTLRRE